MSITTLSEDTVRLLKSSVVITSPFAVAKELLDNAIDAGATSVEITISANTVDMIRVRDNGHGISLEDYYSVGKHAHTSKLRSYVELGVVCGKTLGFRGEALASINGIAKKVSVTTRTTKDPIASKFELRPGEGGATSRQPVSGQVGTTFLIEDLFENIPARKQQAVKSSGRCISELKDLLTSVALARPYLRMAFSVVGKPKHSWRFAPAPQPTTQDALLQCFGKELTSQCTYSEATYSSKIPGHDGDMTYKLQSYLPRPGCDNHSVKGKRAFISVDSRVIAPSLGTSKKIVSILKKILAADLAHHGNNTHPLSPFMLLNIQCSAGAYDPNIAPLKDEVLFVSEQDVLTCFEGLCRKVYSNHDTSSETRGLDATAKGDPMPSAGENGNFDCNNHDKSAGNIHNSDPNSSYDMREDVEMPDDDGDEVARTGVAVPNPQTIRTTCNVNLCRTESDLSSADDNTAIVVELPHKPLMSNKCSGVSSKAPRPLKRIGSPGDIHRYFKRKSRKENSLDFEIATDDTATAGKEPAGVHQKNTSPCSVRSDRLPLQPIGQADANANQAAYRDEHWGVDSSSIVLQGGSDDDLPMAVGARNGSRSPQAHQQLNNRQPDQRHNHGHTYTPPFRRSGSFSQSAFDPPDGGEQDLRTPPPSNTRRSERMLHPSGSLGIGHHTYGDLQRQASLRHNNLAGQNRISLRARNRDTTPRAQDQISSVRGEFTHNDQAIRFTPGIEQSSSPSIPRIPHFQRNAEIQRRNGINPLSESPRVIGTPSTSQPQNHGIWNHLAQNLLMRTPSPIQSGTNTALEMPHHTNNGNQTALGSGKFDELSPNDSQDERPRQRMNKRRRLSSHNLPLESLVQGDVTKNLATTISMDVEDLQNMENIWPGHPLALEAEAGGLEFTSLDEVVALEQRLQDTVNTWVERNELRLEVEYKLRAQLKGESKA